MLFVLPSGGIPSKPLHRLHIVLQSCILSLLVAITLFPFIPCQFPIIQHFEKKLVRAMKKILRVLPNAKTSWVAFDPEIILAMSFF